MPVFSLYYFKDKIMHTLRCEMCSQNLLWCRAISSQFWKSEQRWVIFTGIGCFLA